MRSFYSSLIALIAIVSSVSVQGQSVLNPNDSVITYDKTKPPTQPAYGQIGKWVRTVRMGWDTRAYKCYIYKGVAFRLKFPKSYNPNVADGKKYPLLVFFHGLGEKDTVTDNEFHLLWGAQYFSNSVDDGTFDGYVLFMQSQGFWGDGHYDIVKELIDYMVVNNKLDPFQVIDHGLSSGGQGTWECYFKYPTYINAAIPMSSVAWYYGLRETVDKVKFTPIWNLHGGLDGSPAPYTAFTVNDSMQAAGANYRNTMFPNDYHDSWQSTWREPDFWPFINRVYASNPWALYGRRDYCSLGSVADTIGIVAGYDEYQWRKDGALISGATGNKIYVTQPGTYDARVRRGTLWSDWSRRPVVIRTVTCPTPPTKIEAENYNDMLGIQTETTTDAGGGLDVGWQDTNDWMDYLVNIQSAGNYTLSFRVASIFAGAQFQVRKPDGTVLTTLTVPNTGSWQTFQTIIAQISLPAGEQRLRIFTSAANGGWNLNWWQIQQAAANNQAPTVNAGVDQTITLPASSVTLNGTATDSDGTIATYSWTRVSGPSTPTFGNAAASSTTVTGLVQGTYVFRLTVTDNQGAVTSDDINVNVNAPSSGNTLHIEAENYSSMFGIQTENTSDVGGGLNVGWQDTNDWMNYSVNIPTAGTYPVNFRVASMFTGAQFQLRKSDGTVLATLTVPNTSSFQTWTTITTNVTFPAGAQTLRIYTTLANGGWNFNWWEIVLGGTTPPPNQLPTVNAGIDQTISLPTSTASLNGTASDADGTISTYSWTRVSGPSTVTFGSPNASTTTVSGLVQGSYTIRLTVTDNSGATASDDMIITVNAAANQPPTVNAGVDQTITLPTATTSLTGTASDADGTIATYAWTKVNGPAGLTITSPAAASTTVTGLVQGTYTMRLTVTDNNGSTASDDMIITVNAAGNQVPTVNAGVDQTITLPASSASLTGTASDPDGSISTYAWTKISGPAGSTITTPASASTTVTGLVQGSYVFRLTVTDNKGATASDDITITVAAASTTIHIEAENYTAMFGIQLENTADVGGGQNVGWQDTGDWMDYSVNIPASGTYTVRFRVATEKFNPQFQLRKSDGTVLTTVTVARTGSFQTWATITATVTLTAGTQTLRIYTTAANGGWNINWWEIVSGTTGGVTQLARDNNSIQTLSTDASSLNVYPNPVLGNFTLSVNNNYTGKVNVRIVNSNGTVVKTFNLQKTLTGLTEFNLSVPELKRGVYFIQTSMSGWNANKQVIKQ